MSTHSRLRIDTEILVDDFAGEPEENLMGGENASVAPTPIPTHPVHRRPHGCRTRRNHRRGHRRMDHRPSPDVVGPGRHRQLWPRRAARSDGPAERGSPHRTRLPAADRRVRDRLGGLRCGAHGRGGCPCRRARHDRTGREGHRGTTLEQRHPAARCLLRCRPVARRPWSSTSAPGSRPATSGSTTCASSSARQGFGRRLRPSGFSPAPPCSCTATQSSPGPTQTW